MATIPESFYNNIAKEYDSKKKRNSYYHSQIYHLYKFIIPKKQKVLEIGSATGDLLNAVDPSTGVGIDISSEMVRIAKRKYPKYKFIKKSIENYSKKSNFDYIILSDVVGILGDIEKSFSNLNKIANNETRIVISFYNYLYEPLLNLAGKIGLKIPQPLQSWVSYKDIENFLFLSNLEIVKGGTYLLMPIGIPLISNFVNKYIARLPLIRHLCFVRYLVVRKIPPLKNPNEYSVSLIMPARNESGNITDAIKNIPSLGKKTEIVFIEDHSTDDTRKVMKEAIENYKGNKKLVMLVQTKDRGKAKAVRRGMSVATGDILIIFDSDLTVEPKDLPKFYEAIRDGKGEMVQGSRLVYPMEKQAMRILNVFGNKFFSLTFSFLLDQTIKDTLCGTKLMFKKDYEKLVKNRSYFGDFDPFGDFDLIFGSSKLNLKILEIPIRYKARTYGKSNISRFKNGWTLLRMTLVASRKIKFF